MSQEAIRTAWRNLAADVSWPVPYVDSVSAALDPSTLPDLWSTLQFDAYETSQIGIGPLPQDHRERGGVIVVVWGRAGVGDSSVIDASQLCRDAAFAWTGFPSGYTRGDMGSPDDPQPSGDGLWYGAQFTAEYRYDYVQS